MPSRKLGRGLETLIGQRSHPTVGNESVGPPARTAPDPVPVPEPVPELEPEPPKTTLTVVDLDPKAIKANPEQPRKSFDKEDLQSLKESISKEGLLQPVLVRHVGDDYQLIAGERRLRASQELDLQTIPVIVATVEDERLLELALIENIHRADLNPVEVAEAYRQLMESNRWTQEALSRAIGVSRSSIANSLRLLELPNKMLGSLARAQISPGHAKVLLSVDDPEEQQRLFDRIAEERLSVRELEAARVEEEKLEETGHLDAAPPSPPEAKQPPPKKKIKPQLVRLEEELRSSLGTKVTIHESGGKGKITIEFYSNDDFDRIRSLLTDN